MNWAGFHSLSGLWLLTLLAPLIVLYFLKLKRPRLELPSLALWRQALQDQRVNSPFQRFKRNLLLWLQILLLLLLVLAATQPYWRGGPDTLRRLPVLIDCSASMGALDKPGGITRLEEAKRRAAHMIDGLASDQALCLVSFSRAARKRSGFTNNKRLLHAALDQIEIENVAGVLDEAMRLCQALARSEPFDQVLLLSDGNFPPRVNIDLSFKVDYQPLPPAGPNFGVTALSAQRALDGGWNVFAQIESSAQAEGNLTVELTQDGQVAGSERVTVLRGRGQRLMFHVKGERACALRVSLRPDGFDSLATDNSAALDLPAIRPLRIFVPQTMGACRHALAGLAGLDISTRVPADGSTFDLVISDRAQDFALKTRTRLSIGVVPPGLQPLLTVSSKNSQVVDWRRGAALLQHVELSDLIIMDRPQWQPGGSESALENLGYETLISGYRAPLAVSRHNTDELSVALLFHTDHSTLPYRVGFPILIANMVQAAWEEAGLAEVHGTEGLLSSRATSLAAADRLEFNERLFVSAATVPVKTERPLWPWLTLAALGVLLVEWWFFHRRFVVSP